MERHRQAQKSPGEMTCGAGKTVVIAAGFAPDYDLNLFRTFEDQFSETPTCGHIFNVHVTRIDEDGVIVNPINSPGLYSLTLPTPKGGGFLRRLIHGLTPNNISRRS